MDLSSTRNSTCVKLYLCSNPEDSIIERRVLQECVFPKLREHCRYTLGLDVRVIDPFESRDPSHWPDEHTRRQLITECRQSSAGPFLLALIGHQYGAASLPAQVEVSEYLLLQQEGQQAGVRAQDLDGVYQRDENTIPPSYCLKPLHKHTNHSQSEVVQEEEEIKMKTKEEELLKVFQTTVSLSVHNGCMTPEKAHRYYRSVLDSDLRFALDDCPHNDIAGRCLVYVHKVVNAKREREKEEINSQLQLLSHSEAATSHLRTKPTDEQLLSELCDNFLPAIISFFQLLVYTTTTECDRRHGYTTARRQSYAESLCQQVYSDLVGLIDSLSTSESREGNHLGDDLAREQAEQEELCDILCRFYDIIQPEKENIRAYVEQRDQQCPLVVTGGPCTGKTVLLAHCAQQIKSWLPDINPVVITNFCNLSINSSPTHLLSSLCYQIYNKCHSSPKQGPSFYLCTDTNEPSCFTCPIDQKPNSNPTAAVESHLDPITRERVSDSTIIKADITLSELKEHLSSLLTVLPSPIQPVVLILDGLDQIQNDFSFSIIESLPSPLPPGVKLILTVSPNKSHVLQAIKQHYPQCSSPRCLSEGIEKKGQGHVCVHLAPNRKGCVKMLAWLLTGSGRKVTSGQQALVNQALTTCCLTLYARLLHVQTSLWKSDFEVTESSLPDGVHSSISALLDHLEQKHGSSIVTRAVSYLTLSRTGLTEAELGDLLSCDNQVLAEYVQQCESPPFTVRVPQIDWERLLLDLRRFLIQRTVAGSRVLFWVSRHFKLVVAKRYLNTHQLRTEIHSEMADYFSGRWACGNAKPLCLKEKSGQEKDSTQMKICIDRLPSNQPFVFTSSSKDIGHVNLRKVAELPYHLQLSNRWGELECRLLMSLRFHQAMVRAGLLRDLMAMLCHEDESFQFLFSREKLLLASILKSSACLLQRTPLQLPMTIETSLLPYLDVFPALEDYVREIRQEMSERESGLRLALCPAPSTVPSIQSLQVDLNTTDVSVVEAAETECGIVAEIMDDGSAWVWKNTKPGLLQMSLSCEQKEVKFSGVKSSGQFMLLSTHCKKLFLWDVTGPQVFRETSQQTHYKIAGFVACKERLFMWWENESCVCVFDISSETLAHLQCQSSVTCLVCSTNGFYICCGQEEGSVSIFDTETSTLLGTCSNSSHNAVTLIILCEDKGEMACVNKMGNITLWDVATKTQPPRLVKESFSGGKLKNISNIDYSEESDILLLCQSHQVTLWDTCDWVILDQFLAPQERAFTQAVLSHHSHLFLALLDKCALILVWQLDTGECVLSLETNKQPHTLLKTASDVICVTHDGCLTVWDSEMIALAGTAPKMRCAVREVVVEQTGEWFYTTDGSQAVWRWSLEAGHPHANFLHDGPVEKLRLSPNGIHLVSLSAGEIYIWLTETGENTLRISCSRTTDILITPNSNFGVSISKRGLSQVWKLTHGSIVCSIHLYLSDAQVSPESTFLIGLRCGDLLAASLWSGSISKRFSCVEISEHVVAFQTLSEHPDFVVVMAASGAVFTWKMAEETVCRHFQLPYMFHCQPHDFQMSSDGSYALLSTVNEVINILDLHQVRLCSFKSEGPVITAHLNKTGGYAIYISGPTCQEKSCTCHPHTKPVLTVVRLADGEKVGSVHLCKNPTALVCEWQCVFVGFEDGSVGVYSVSDVMTKREESIRCREVLNNQLKQCPFDRAPFSCLPLQTPNITWP
ncbi:NACHT and WD repeat domain-containing protein 2 [Channa argus]|uniref:NACHT and WD repeat domain-containing protein 2 n=1 Tax=Channa argus TaxID=215402 RepID=A0A6G1PRG8_CHAAH|nr:NACHT and WD repeat domain-containing protein 2 [Channa argus]